jgi:hypothetical protein
MTFLSVPPILASASYGLRLFRPAQDVPAPVRRNPLRCASQHCCAMVDLGFKARASANSYSALWKHSRVSDEQFTGCESPLPRCRLRIVCAPLRTPAQFWVHLCPFSGRPTNREQNLRLARGDQRSRRRKFRLDHFRRRHFTRLRDWRCRYPKCRSQARDQPRERIRKIDRQSGQRESNPHGQLGRLELYH